jgi:hypothetical protein
LLFVEGSELFACGRLSIAVNWLRPQGKGLAEISRSEIPIAFGLVNKASDGGGRDKLELELDGPVEIGKGSIEVTLAAIGVTAVLVQGRKWNSL